MKSISHKQHGVVLLEALIAILIFSIGVLAVIAMYASAHTQTYGAQYRTEAINHADQLMNEIWMSADRRPDESAIFGSISSFAYNTAGGACVFSGGFAVAGPGNAFVNDLVNRVTAGVRPLPGATAASVQVIVLPEAQDHQIQITICWQPPEEAGAGIWRQHVVVGNVS